MVQGKYASDVVNRFGMAEANVCSTPFEPRSSFGMEEVQEQEGVDRGMADVPYKSLVGNHMYLVVCTRLDLAMAVSALRRCCHKPQSGVLGGSQAGAAIYEGDNWRRARVQRC